jgi:nitroimidazol reductase NimA-like FMN-containing flavoprotein (pyridoxamine 5'-phosphate oxidase superfamily)
VKEQRRGRAIAMTESERDAFLAERAVCRVGSLGADGSPHVAPLWFVWHDQHLWLSSLTPSQRWTDLERDSRVAVTIDAGEAYYELRGVELRGRVTVVGDVPRTTAPVAELEEVERLMAEKYDLAAWEPDGKHAWLRVDADKISSWDFRKIDPARRPTIQAGES